jgi:hypothetical protein
MSSSLSSLLMTRTRLREKLRSITGGVFIQELEKCAPECSPSIADRKILSAQGESQKGRGSNSKSCMRIITLDLIGKKSTIVPDYCEPFDFIYIPAYLFGSSNIKFRHERLDI